MSLRLLGSLGLGLTGLCAGHVVPPGFDTATAKYRDSLHLLFESVREEVTSEELPVTSGALPRWLSGAKFNNGFGKFEADGGGRPFMINHLADVMSYMTKFEFSNGTVRLTDKVLHTNYWQKSFNEIPTFRNFNGTTPDFTLEGRAKVLENSLAPNDNLNVAAIQLLQSAPDRMFANSDMKGFNEVDRDLNYVGWVNFTEVNKPKGGTFDMISCTHIGNTLGDKYIYGYNYLLFDKGVGESSLAAWRIDMTQPDNGRGSPLVREWLDTVTMPSRTHLSYMHTIANSPKYLVFVGSVFQYNILEIPAHTRLLKCMEYHGEEKNQVWVLNKATGMFIKTFTADADWFYHFVNVYDEGDTVVMDYNAVDYRHIETAFSTWDLRQDAPWRFTARPTRRLVVDVSAPDGAHFSPTDVGPSFDLATIHPNIHGHKHRWTWGLAWSGRTLWYDTIIKQDVANNKVVATWKRDDHYPGELNAVAKPGATGEDDVVILTVVLGGDYGTSYLLVLDGKDLSPIAEAKSRFPLPFGSHGCWQPHGEKMQGCIGETTADPDGKALEIPPLKKGELIV